MNSETSYVDELSGVYNRRYLKEKQRQATVNFIFKNVSLFGYR